MSNKNKIEWAYNELVQYGYSKNDILCVGLNSKNNILYALAIPTFEQLLVKDLLVSTKNVIVYDIRDFYQWFEPKENRKLFCLQQEENIKMLLENLEYNYITYGEKAFKSGKADKEFTTVRLLCKIFRKHYQLISQNEISDATWCNKDTFFKQLTYAEKDALKYISAEIGAEGDVSISKMITKYPLSRPVWNNLFKKIQEFNIGEIINRGVKGTHINITHPQLRYDMQNRKI